MSNTILRLPQVKVRVGLSRSTIYASIQTGTFPAPVKLGARAVGWVAGDIDRWVDQQIQRSQQGQ